MVVSYHGAPAASGRSQSLLRLSVLRPHFLTSWCLQEFPRPLGWLANCWAATHGPAGDSDRDISGLWAGDLKQKVLE